MPCGRFGCLVSVSLACARNTTQLRQVEGRGRDGGGSIFWRAAEVALGGTPSQKAPQTDLAVATRFLLLISVIAPGRCMHHKVFCVGRSTHLPWLNSPLGKLHAEGLELLRRHGWVQVGPDAQLLPVFAFTTRKGETLKSQPPAFLAGLLPEQEAESS
jgi:hypothetical protein